MKTLLTRSLSGVVFAALMLAGICIHPYGLVLLFFIINIGCLWEYYSITKAFYDTGRRHFWNCLTLSLLNGAGIYMWFAFAAFNQISAYKVWIIFPMSMLIVAVELRSLSPVAIRNAALSMFGQLYIALPFALLLWMIDTTPFNHTSHDWFPTGCAPILGLLLLVWANDTFAYLGGSLIGKHKLYPEISPGKTWEGFMVGALCCMAASYGLYKWLGVYDLKIWIGLSLIASIVGTIGDLFESMIKRNAGIKDSGKIMPGHGGFLDRFDAFLFCIPFAYAWLRIAVS